MGVSFDHIPANLRVPGTYIEMDASQAGSGLSTAKPSLLIAQMISTGSATAETVVDIGPASEAADAFEFGSHLHRSVVAFRANNSTGKLYCIGIADAGGSTAATGKLTITGPATADGTLYFRVGGQLLDDLGSSGTQDGSVIGIAVSDTDTATDIGDAIEDALGVNEAAAVTAKSPYPVTASNAAGVVTLTARNKGTLGGYASHTDNIFLSLNAEDGEAFPAGVSVVITDEMGALAAGTGDPTVPATITAMGDVEYDYIGHPFAAMSTPATPLDLFEAEMGDNGRWGYSRAIYGHMFSSIVGSRSVLSTFGTSRNDPHHSITGLDHVPSPPWEMAGAVTGACARYLDMDPARPLQRLRLHGIVPPRDNDIFTMAERQVLLMDGIATTYVSGGRLYMERIRTNYLTDANGAPDDAWLDVQTPATLTILNRELAAAIESNYGRHKLADDGTPVSAGQAIVRPMDIRGLCATLYDGWIRRGLVENKAAFMAELVVQRSGDDPNRIDMIFPPDLMNQKRVVAIKHSFRLQYAA